MSSVSRLLRRLWAHEHFPYSLRVLIALSALMWLCWRTDHMHLQMPLFLGAIACAIAETDDGWRGRLRAVLLTLVCFALAAFSVQAAAPHPALFVAGLVVATFGFIMLGAISPRYMAIGYASVILSIYTAITMEQHAQHALRGGVVPDWIEPVLLLAGAAWYGLLSVLWAALFVHQPVQQNLAALYRQLADYLRVKASLFEPVRDMNEERRRLSLAQLNGGVVTALNTAKEGIFSRLRFTRNPRISRYLRLYFIAQDVHERASSSHDPYADLADTFYHSDVMFRCQRVLRLQGDDCERLAQAIQLRQPFIKGDDSRQALLDLQASIEFLAAQQRPDWQGRLDTLRALARNLGTLDAQLARASRPLAGQADTASDQSLLDRSPRTLREAWDRVRLQLNPGAPLFRHAVRLSLALALGYGLLRLFPSEQGFWVLLTTVFVCQPGFGATRRRVTQRVGGTFLGLVLGWALLRLFPEPVLQASFAVAAGVVFFATRRTRYTVATAAITAVVLLCANQVGNGDDLIVPRMVDTVLGSFIATLAVFLILPDWQGRRMHEVVARAVASNATYLRQLLAQYRDGKHDDLPYRLARRNAHNADAAFSAAVANLLQEPGFIQRDGDTSLRLLVLTHTLLSYLSALGAHRDRLPDGEAREQALALGEQLADALDAQAAQLRAASEPATRGAARDSSAEASAPVPNASSKDDISSASGASSAFSTSNATSAADAPAATVDPRVRLVLNQLALLDRQRVLLAQFAARLRA